MTRPRSRLRNRRPGLIPGRRFALALAVVWLGGSGGVAVADQNASQLVTATVFQPGKPPTPDSVTIGTLESDPQRCPTYSGPVSGFQGPGGDSQLPLASTWPLASVLACLTTPVSISDVTQVVVFKQAGSPEAALASQLSRGDLKSPSDFPLSAQSPVISGDGTGIIYNRPSRGPSDNNAFDQAVAANPTPFLIEVFEGPPLDVVATASTTRIAPGGTVRFGEVVRPPNQTGLMYDWNFDGAAGNSSSATPSVKFNLQGSYPVTLQVTDPAGGGGTGTITIEVGPQTPALSGTHNQPGGGKAPKSRSPNGPQNSGGARVGGPAGKPKPKAPGTTAAQKHKSGGSSQHRNSGSRSKRSTHTPTPRSASRQRSTTPAKPPPPRPAFNPARAPLITGRLVSDVRLLPADASPLVQAIPATVATAPPARRAIRASLLPALAGVLAIVSLFLLGARRELRGPGGWRGWRVARTRG